MGVMARLLASFAVSLVAAGGVQQIMMAAAHVVDPLDALPWLAGIVAAVSVVFALTAWRGGRAVTITAIALLGVMLVVAAGGMAIGLANRSPEVGGDILYGLAQMIDIYFLLPSVIAIPVHWGLLRRERQDAMP